jgi:predicted lipoprotein with Yx(FWY)xxD motif
MRRAAVVLAVLAALAAAGGAPGAPSSGATVKSAYSKLLKKTLVVDARGRTLYMYVSDFGGKSACVDDATYHCSKVWPPLLTTGAPVAGAGVKQKLLGTITRDDGTTQVTLKGHPLYRFVGYSGTPPDKKAGDVHGQGFIGVWWVMSPTGAVLRNVFPKP